MVMILGRPVASSSASRQARALRVTGSRNGSAHRIAADEFSETVTFSFRIGNDAYNWEWTSCSKDTEAADGIGLPGHHGCGAERVLSSAPYLG